ncbi:MAG: outer membrane beta-barrel protein [Gemmataceae bacterium]
MRYRRILGITRKLGGWMGALVLGFGGMVNAQTPPLPPEPTETAPAGPVGGFEADDPVLNDDVMSGVIYKGQGWYLFPQGERTSVRGWLDGGFMGNSGNPGSKFNGPYNAVDRANEAMFNQAYLIAERVLPTDESFGAGGRVDLLYGEDFLLAMSQGWEIQPGGGDGWNSGQYYGLAIPQLYAEFGTQELSVKLGHFYTIVGYEGVPAVGNFFYSKAYSYQFAGPFTEWGGLATWRPTKNFEVIGGLVNGWNAVDANINAVNFLGRARVQNDPNSLAASFAIITGDQPSNIAGLPNIADVAANRTRYSLILEARPTNRLEYVFHQWLGTQTDGAPLGGTALWAGIDQYLYYSVSEQWKAGARFEWFNDVDGTRVGLNRPSNPNKPPLPGNFFSLTVGPNWLPTQNLMLRPELRWDFYDGEAKPYNDGTKTNQLMLGFDAILKF